VSFDAGAITGSLIFDISPFAHGMLQAESIAHLFPHVVSSFLADPLLGLIDIAERSAKSIGHMVEEIVKKFDNLGEVAETAGLSAQFLARIGPVAEDAGSSMFSLVDMTKFLERNLFEAAHGNKELAASFADVGLDVNDLLKLEPDKAFLKVADAIAHAGSQAQKTHAAMALLGRGGADSLAFLNMGADEINRRGSIFEGLGVVPDSDLVKASDQVATIGKYYDAMWEGVKVKLSEPIVKYVAKHADEITATFKRVSVKFGEAIDVVKNEAASKLPIVEQLFKDLAAEMEKLHIPNELETSLDRVKDALKNSSGDAQAVGIVLTEIGNISLKTLAAELESINFFLEVMNKAAMAVRDTFRDIRDLGNMIKDVASSPREAVADVQQRNQADVNRRVDDALDDFYSPRHGIGPNGGEATTDDPGGDRGGAGGGRKSAGGGGAAGNTYNVTVMVDGKESTQQLANKIHPAIQKAKQEMKSQISATTSAQRVLEGL
jgi:hypothetical protein